MILGGSPYGALEFGGDQSKGPNGTAAPAGQTAASAENNPVGIATAKPLGVSAVSAEHNPIATVPAMPSGVAAASAVHQPIGAAKAKPTGVTATSAEHAPFATVSGHAFDHDAFDSGAFDTDGGAEAVLFVPLELMLSETSGADGGFLVEKDLAKIRGKFIYRNAPPDQNAVVSIEGILSRSAAGEVEANGVVDIEDEDLAAVLLQFDEALIAEETVAAMELCISENQDQINSAVQKAKAEWDEKQKKREEGYADLLLRTVYLGASIDEMQKLQNAINAMRTAEAKTLYSTIQEAAAAEVRKLVGQMGIDVKVGD